MEQLENKYLFDTQKIINAVHFATQAHGKQKRKFSDDPYILHPIRVAEITLFYSKSNGLMIPALLHDVVEDTNVTVKEIQENFGIVAANLVADVTDDKLDVKKAPSKGIYHYEKMRKFLMNNNYDAIMLKLCDRLDNLIDSKNNFVEATKKIEEFQNAGHARLMQIIHSDMHYKLVIEDIRKMCRLMVFNTRFVLNFLFTCCKCNVILQICKDIETVSDDLLKLIKI